MKYALLIAAYLAVAMPFAVIVGKFIKAGA